MSTIKAYDHPYETQRLKPIDGEWSGPGTRVTCVDMWSKSSGVGIVVSDEGGVLTVVWSVEPDDDCWRRMIDSVRALAGRQVNYQQVARDLFNVEQMPKGALPFYFDTNDTDDGKTDKE